MKRKGDWIQTYLGNQFWPLDPDPDEVYIEDIAHALSLLCRFGGHCERFYSVAEHSILVSSIAPQHLKLIGLLHDAAEAYICDIPRPIKKDLREYTKIEFKIETAIYKHFGIPNEFILPYRVDIKEIDVAVLTAEKQTIMKYPPHAWTTDCVPAPVRLNCWHPDIAEKRFLETFYQLYPNFINNKKTKKECLTCRHDPKNNGLGYYTHDPCNYCADFEDWEGIE